MVEDLSLQVAHFVRRHELSEESLCQTAVGAIIIAVEAGEQLVDLAGDLVERALRQLLEVQLTNPEHAADQVFSVMLDQLIEELFEAVGALSVGRRELTANLILQNLLLLHEKASLHLDGDRVVAVFDVK